MSIYLPNRIYSHDVWCTAIICFRKKHLFFSFRIEHRCIDEPLRPEYIHGYREYVVVQKASVKREQGHEQNNVSAGEEDSEDLVLLLRAKFLFGKDHPQRKRRHDGGVSAVAEHHGEEEGERYDREDP